MRLSVATVVLSLSIVALAAAADVDAAIKRYTNIPPQSLGQALRSLAKERDFQIVYASSEVSGRRTDGAVGEFTTAEALDRLLSGSGLGYRYLDEKTITLVARADTQGAAEPTTATEPPKPVLEEVVVTAQKREQRLQDVPVPVTAVSPGVLIENNQSRLQDYYTRVPGLNLAPGALYGSAAIAIRGITTGSEISPTVGVVIDDVSYTSSHPYLHSYTVTEVDPSDLKSIEVLRGPQGTLYGASSMGGLLKYVTVEPSVDRFSGQARAGLSAVDRGGGVGHYVSGAVNVPVSDEAAIRVSGYTRRDPGYIDDPLTGQHSKNTATTSGGRLAALWRPTEKTAVKLGALYQEYTLDAPAYVTLAPGLGELQQDVVPGARNYKAIQVYSATLEQEIGAAHLTSIAAYSILENRDRYDLSYYFGGMGAPYGVSKARSPALTQAKRFTEETRVTLPLNDKVEWLLGGLYVHIDGTNWQPVFVNDAQTGADVAEIAFQSYKIPLDEYAAFTNLTFHLTDRIDVQIGGRKNRVEQKFDGFLEGTLVGGTRIPFSGRSSDDSFTYLATAQYKFSPDAMVYTRIATGFRPGGPNTVAAAGVPSSYAPDKTQNYEIGAKGRLFDGLMTFDASLYRIDWDSIQLSLFNVLSYTGNGGRARSQGAELSVESRVSKHFKLSGWLALSDAELTQDFPATATVSGRKGDRLPFSSRFSGEVSAEYERNIGAGATGFIGATVTYQTRRAGEFSSAGARFTAPAYTKSDLTAGIRFDSWSATAYVNNLTDRYVFTARSTVNPADFVVLQPRTIGLTMTKSF